MASFNAIVQQASAMDKAFYDERGVVVQDIGVRRPTLDDAFLTLTGHGADEGAAVDERAVARTPGGTS